MTPTPSSNSVAEVIERALVSQLGVDILDRPGQRLGEAVMQALANADLAVIDVSRTPEELVDQTMMRGLHIDKRGVALELLPPRELAAQWVHCARGMLGDAPNYSETIAEFPPEPDSGQPEATRSVSFEISPAGSADRYALIVQRVGKLSPHEARTLAEERALKAEATAEQLQYERRLLGTARMVLDLVAAGDPSRWDQARKEAESLAQRIVDEIGHPVTDEPALSPGYRTQLDQSEARIEHLTTGPAEPATVYLAIGGEYDGRWVRKVFARREDAASYGCADGVEEWQVNTGPVETRTWIRAIWTINDPAAPEYLFDAVNPFDLDGYSEVRDYDGQAGALAVEWWPPYSDGEPWQIQISGWDPDLATAAWKQRRDRLVASGGTLQLPLDADAP
ncbi:hypothetical protein ACFWYW_46490 [Nonomuraea sp. NPDC059023]|uniref:hypothetical protein n=1 Tax=unclassified Nonomuraea TaxID=2593643 RepID=UPI00369ED536